MFVFVRDLKRTHQPGIDGEKRSMIMIKHFLKQFLQFQTSGTLEERI